MLISTWKKPFGLRGLYTNISSWWELGDCMWLYSARTDMITFCCENLPTVIYTVNVASVIWTRTDRKFMNVRQYWQRRLASSDSPSAECLVIISQLHSNRSSSESFSVLGAISPAVISQRNPFNTGTVSRLRRSGVTERPSGNKGLEAYTSTRKYKKRGILGIWRAVTATQTPTPP